MLPLSVLMAAVAIIILKSGAMPRGLGWLAAITAPLLLVNGMFLDAESDLRSCSPALDAARKRRPHRPAERCPIAGRTGHGATVKSPWIDAATITANAVSGNATDGIFIDSTSDGTLVERNLDDGNGDDGIDLDSPVSTVGGNRANENGDLGIEAERGVTDAAPAALQRSVYPCLSRRPAARRWMSSQVVADAAEAWSAIGLISVRSSFAFRVARLLLVDWPLDLQPGADLDHAAAASTGTGWTNSRFARRIPVRGSCATR
jgi:hypothetical protein